LEWTLEAARIPESRARLDWQILVTLQQREALVQRWLPLAIHLP
jgi:hypothetical protein